MKYSEFNKNFPDLELQYTDESLFIYCDGTMVGKVSKKNRYVLSTNFNTFREFKPEYAAKLLMNMVLLAETSLADREEEKRYWLRKIPVPLLGETKGSYFCKPRFPNYQPCVDKDRSENHQFQTIFTESEISQMDITGFEKEEFTE